MSTPCPEEDNLSLDCLLAAVPIKPKELKALLRQYNIPTHKENGTVWVDRQCAMQALININKACPFKEQIPDWAITITEANKINKKLATAIKNTAGILVYQFRIPAADGTTKVVPALSRAEFDWCARSVRAV